MILYFDDTKVGYQFSNIYCEERNKTNGTYTLSGLSSEMISIATNYLLSKKCFNCKILNAEKVLLIGEDCWFNDVNQFIKTTSLLVSWVEQDNI